MQDMAFNVKVSRELKMNKLKLIPADKAAEFPYFPLTQEHRRFEQSVERARMLLSDLRQVINAELNQLINGMSLEVDINLCQGNSLDLWLKESGRLMMGCPIANEFDEHTYLAMDNISAHHLADICLGGEISQSLDPDSCIDLSATECRVAGRLLHRTTLAIQKRFNGNKSALPALRIEKMAAPASYIYLPFKVRVLLEKDALSWFLWLPSTMFVAPEEPEINRDKMPIMSSDEQWLGFPVKGRVEMASRSISLSLLNACMNGAVLPIEMSKEAVFKLDKQVLLKGRVVEQDNSLAFQVTKTKELTL